MTPDLIWALLTILRAKEPTDAPGVPTPLVEELVRRNMVHVAKRIDCYDEVAYARIYVGKVPFYEVTPLGQRAIDLAVMATCGV